MQTPVVWSIVAILGAAAAALFCDLLRTMNLRFREAAVESRVRRVEKQQAARGKDSSSKLAQRAVEQAFTVAPPQAPAPARTDRNKDDMSSTQTLSSWLLKRAADRAAEQAPPVVPVSRTHQVVVDEFLWSSLFTSPARESRPEPAFGLIQGSGPHAALSVPGGFHDAAVLERLIQSGRLFTGLAMSIGASQSDEQLRSLEVFLKTVLRPADFVCRSPADQLILLCPAETGTEARAYLSVLSEQLWDFQLGSLGTSSNLFSIGGVGVRRETLADAVALANERMCQTRRSRKTVSMPLPRRRAV